MAKRMKKCKVKGCENKYHAKGYCQFHYNRKFVLKIPFTRRCKWCRRVVPIRHRKFCSQTCKNKYDYKINKEEILEEGRNYYKTNKERLLKHKRENYVAIPQFGGVRGTTYVFTDGVTKEMKKLVPKIRNEVLEDCIKNPRKYL